MCLLKAVDSEQYSSLTEGLSLEPSYRDDLVAVSEQMLAMFNATLLLCFRLSHFYLKYLEQHLAHLQCGYVAQRVYLHYNKHVFPNRKNLMFLANSLERLLE